MITPPTSDMQQRAISPFSLGEQSKRAVWNAVYWCLFASSPRVCHGWRRFLLRLFGAKVSSTAHIYPRVIIWAPWNLEIGELVGVADDVVLYTQARITLADHVTVSQEAFLCTGSHDYSVPQFPLWTAPITIKQNAWVAARAFIHPGVLVGENAVVGACAVVTRNVPAGAVVAGNPASVVKYRDGYDKN